MRTAGSGSSTLVDVTGWVPGGAVAGDEVVGGDVAGGEVTGAVGAGAVGAGAVGAGPGSLGIWMFDGTVFSAGASVLVAARAVVLVRVAEPEPEPPVEEAGRLVPLVMVVGPATVEEVLVVPRVDAGAAWRLEIGVG